MKTKATVLPKEIKEYLDRFVIGQDEAKKTLATTAYLTQLKYSVFNQLKSDKINKVTPLLIGQTGCGKTYLLDRLLEFTDGVAVVVNGSSLKASGFSPESQKDIFMWIEYYIQQCALKAASSFQNLLQSESIENTTDNFNSILNYYIMTGYVIIDEFDKLSLHNDGSSSGKYLSQVQDDLLKAMEGMKINVKLFADKKSLFSQRDFETNTSMITFILAGAFSDLRKEKEDNKAKLPVGFASKAVTADSTEISKADLESAGFKLELVGRITYITLLNPLTKEDYRAIITQAEDNVYSQYQLLFTINGISMKFSEELIEDLLNVVEQSPLGARAISGFIAENIKDLIYELPYLHDKEIILDLSDNKLIIRKDSQSLMVKN